MAPGESIGGNFRAGNKTQVLASRLSCCFIEIGARREGKQRRAILNGA